MMEVLRLGIVVLLTMSQVDSESNGKWESEIGVPMVIQELVVPGPRLYAKPIELESPIVLRIVNVFAHGDQWRYNIEWYGLEPGQHDLRDMLQTEDGSAPQCAELPVTVTSQLPAGIVRPNAPTTTAAPRIGGYQRLLWLGGIVWLIVLIVLLKAGRRKKTDEPTELAEMPTLADRLRPLVALAIEGQLSDVQKAELEMALLNYWQQRLGLGDQTQVAALQEIRGHQDAGPLFVALESWLHRPPPHRVDNLEKLLEPYRNVAADDVALPQPTTESVPA